MKSIEMRSSGTVIISPLFSLPLSCSCLTISNRIFFDTFECFRGQQMRLYWQEDCVSKCGPCLLLQTNKNLIRVTPEGCGRDTNSSNGQYVGISIECLFQLKIPENQYR